VLLLVVPVEESVSVVPPLSPQPPRPSVTANIKDAKREVVVSFMPPDTAASVTAVTLI
jgi:hypothetical protein